MREEEPISSHLLEIPKRAGLLLQDMQKRVQEIQRAEKDIVTEADLASEAFIIKSLGVITPNLPIYSEEAGGDLDGATRWIIDPLDGTMNYSQQDDHWGISIAYVRDEQVAFGVVNLPALNLFLPVSRRKDGVTNEHSRYSRLNEPEWIRVNSEPKLTKRAGVWIDWIKGDNDTIVLPLIQKLLGANLYPGIRVCCTASMAMVATGKIAAYVQPKPAPEDFPAAALIVEKAGGRVTDLAGNPWSVRSTSIVATNGLVHDELLAVLNR